MSNVAGGIRIDVFHHVDPTGGVDVAAKLAALTALVTTLREEQHIMATALERIQSDVGRISADIATISDKLKASEGGISATDANALADQLDTAVSALDVLAAPPAAPTDAPPAP